MLPLVRTNAIAVNFTSTITLLLLTVLTACSTSNFRHQKYTHFDHRKGRKLSATKHESTSDQAITADFKSLEQQIRIESQDDISEVTPPSLAKIVLEEEKSQTDQISIPNEIATSEETAPRKTTKPIQELASKKSSPKKMETKIRRGSWLGYSFFIAAALCTGLYLISIVSSLLLEIVLVAFWFLIPAFVVTAITLLLFAFFRGRKYLKNQDAIGETRNEQVARFQLANSIMLGVCAAAVISLVVVFVLVMSSI